MANAPKRPCVGGCGRLVESGRCEHCKLPTGSAARGYDNDWLRLRVLCFERDHWRCVDCGWEPDTVRMCRQAGIPLPPSKDLLRELRLAYARRERHLHADHEVPIHLRPELRLDLSNLRTRCNVCHNAKTVREDGGFGKYYGGAPRVVKQQPESPAGELPPGRTRFAV